MFTQCNLTDFTGSKTIHTTLIFLKKTNQNKLLNLNHYQ